jgi:cytochrome c biogenesis protein CcdA
LLYTLAGCISALAVGAVLGFLGSVLRVNRACWLIVPLALALAARDLGWLRFELPERKCQTEKVWAHEFGFVMASAMWGFHLGLGFSTYIRYGGYWVLTFTALGMGDARYGAILVVMYWLGRALPVWVMPIIWRTRDPRELMSAILTTGRIYNRSDALTLIWSSCILLIWLLQPSLAAGHTH